MSMIVTQRADFECSYVTSIQQLTGLELHSHRYRVEFSVTRDVAALEYGQGMIIEFGQFAKLIKSILPDHKFLYNCNNLQVSAEVQIAATIENHIPNSVHAYTVPITAENLCNQLVIDLQAVLDTKYLGVRIINAKLRESSESYAEYKAPGQSLQYIVHTCE